MNIFLTGGTGFIGSHLLPELASQHKIYVLIRHPNRLQPIVNQLPMDQQPNIIPVIGDLTYSRLGLDDTSYENIAASDLIIHAGGPMNIELSLDQAERSFLQPAKALVHLAKDIHAIRGLKHFIHIVGFMSPYNEQNAMSDIDQLLEKAPPYEKIKFLADSYIRKALHPMNIPLSTVNPSVVIGDSFSGRTEQLGGLSILIDAVRRNLMPLVPGGDDHWLPMVHVDHVASFIAKLANSEGLTSNTYYLLDSKRDSPSIRVLIQLIAKELRVTPPMGTVSLPLLKTVLGMGAGKLLGIPKESMNFLVKADFPVDTKIDIVQNYKLKSSIVSSTLPFVISDLDYRLNHFVTKHQEVFFQRRRASLVSMEKNIQGMPVIFLHGTFSGADALMPIAESLGYVNTWFIDLPGFGRTPYHHQPSIIDGYVESVAAMIMELKTPVVLVGHSFGGLIAARVMQRLRSQIPQLLLLQPVLHPVEPIYKTSSVTKQILKYMKPSHMKRQMLKHKHFMEDSKRLKEYIDYVMVDVKSPRIRATNAEVMSLLTQSKSFLLNPELWDQYKIKILWGEKDRNHYIPKPYEHLDITRIPYGHQFPIEDPRLTAEWIRQAVNFEQYMG